MRAIRTLIVALALVVVPLLSPGVANAAWTPQSGSACDSETPERAGSTAGQQPDVEIPAITVSTELSHEGDNWPVVMHQESVALGANGKLVRSYYTMAVKPAASSTKGPASSLAYVTCTYNAAIYIASGSDGGTGVWANIKNYAYRTAFYESTLNVTKWSYTIYLTEEWWTRPDSNYTVMSAQAGWVMEGWDCTNTFVRNSAGTGIGVGWQSGTASYVYSNTTPMSGWSTRTKGPNNVGTQASSLSSDVYWLGVYTASTYSINTFNP